MKATFEVKLVDGYVRCEHSKRGLICAGVLKNGRLSDVSFLRDEDIKCNMIRMPAMMAMQKWEKAKQ